MPSIFENIALVFGLVAIAYIAGRLRVVGPRVGEALTEFAVALLLPVLLFRTLVEAEFEGIDPWSLWLSYFAGVAIVWAAGQFTATRFFGRDSRAGVVAGVSVSFSNLMLIGVPLILGIYGQAGFEVMSMILMVHLPVMMAASIILLAWADRQSGALSPGRVVRDFLRAFFGNPIIIGILCGIAWRITGVPLPEFASRLVQSISGVAGTVALLAVGLGLVRFGMARAVAQALALAPFKLVLLPAIVLAFSWLLGLQPLTAKVAVAAASLPTGINPYLIAARFRTGEALASNMMLATTALAAVTASVWLLVAEAVFG